MPGVQWRILSLLYSGVTSEPKTFIAISLSSLKVVQRNNNKSEKVPLDWKTFKATDKWQNIVLPPIDLLTKDIDDLTPEDFYDADFEVRSRMWHATDCVISWLATRQTLVVVSSACHH